MPAVSHHVENGHSGGRLDEFGRKCAPHDEWPVLRIPMEQAQELGEAIYRSNLQTELEENHIGQFVVIDVESADYEVAETTIDGMRKLARRHPDAQIWIERIGSRAACLIR